MLKLGIVTGLAREAEAARAAIGRSYVPRKQVLICCRGPGLARAEEAARALLADGADILMSFGLAGALQPGLAAGTLLLPRRVIAAEGTPLASEADLVDGLAFALASAVPISRADLVSVAIVVGSAAQKAALGEASHAAGVDMESYGVARAARAAGKPFVVMRTISDPVERVISPVAQAGMGADGRVHPLKVLRGLIQTPSAIPEIARLAGDSNRALKTLSRAARLAFPILLLGR